MPTAASGLLVQLVTMIVVVIGVLQIKAGVMATGAFIAVVLHTGRAMVPVAAAVSMLARGYRSMAQFHALAGMVPAQDGLITLDGHALYRFSIPQLRRGVVYSAQDAMIFEGTLWHNILLAMPEPEVEVTRRAIRCSGLDTFVACTAEGYIRAVGPRGSALSGDRRQAVLLLDEPTASLDIASKAAVIAGFAEAIRSQTLIVATHRLALLGIVDRAIWPEDGRIVADRPKADVLAQLAAQNGKHGLREAA